MALVDVPLLQTLIASSRRAKGTQAQSRNTRIAGVFFAITFIASIPALFLYEALALQAE